MSSLKAVVPAAAAEVEEVVGAARVLRLRALPPRPRGDRLLAGVLLKCEAQMMKSPFMNKHLPLRYISSSLAGL